MSNTTKPTIVCCFCKKDAGQYGNNPEPVMGTPNKCCDQCNLKVVLPARFNMTARFNATRKAGETKAKYVPAELKEKKEIAVATTTDGKVLTFPLQSGEGDVCDDATYVEMNGEIVLSGHDAFHDDVMIRTTKKEIEDVMSEIDTMDKAKHCFRHSWDRIKNINTDALYLEGGAKWKDFLDDIVVYYCARFKLFGKPMPAVHTPQMKEMIAKIGMGDAQADFTNNTIVSKK